MGIALDLQAVHKYELGGFVQPFTRTFYRIGNDEIIDLCKSILNKGPYQRIEGTALIRGLQIYSRECLLDNQVSRVGAYSRRFIDALGCRLFL